MTARAPTCSRVLFPRHAVGQSLDFYRPLLANQRGVLLEPLTAEPIYSWYDRSEYSFAFDDASTPRFLRPAEGGAVIEETPIHAVVEGPAVDLFDAYLAADRAYLRCTLSPPFESPLADDVFYSALVNFPSARARSKIMVFLSKAGSITNLHFDEGPSITSISLRGTKRYTLIAPEFSLALQPYPETSVYRRRSRIDGDLEGVLMSERYPTLHDIPKHVCTIHPGDCITIPPLWWHTVKTLSDDTITLVLST